MEDLESLGDALRESLEELVEVAGGRKPKRRRRKLEPV
jgi:hypothetical protein